MNAASRPARRRAPACAIACALAAAVVGTAPVTRAQDPAGPARLQAFDAREGRAVAPEALFDTLAQADVVFLGEQHDDAASHRFELRVLEALRRRGRPVVLAMEMFERDQQPLLEAYVGGRIVEAHLMARIQPWSNYGADYRPLVEYARAQGWPVVASNAPRRLAARVAREGLGVLRGLGPAERRLVAREVRCPDDAYRARFAAALAEGGAHGGPGAPAPRLQRLYEAQCLKDETMAETLAGLVAPGVTVVHVNGGFHSEGRLGIVPRLARRRPEARALVVSIVPPARLAPGTPLSSRAGEGDLVVLPGDG